MNLCYTDKELKMLVSYGLEGENYHYAENGGLVENENSSYSPNTIGIFGNAFLCDLKESSIEDEYDVQDLLHALLRLYFDDVRPEEWTPSYAGKSARMDFLLKEEKIVIEVKKTRKGLGDKELGDQLIIDVERYKIHPDCKKLICFIYDPEGRIGNPGGLVSDLNNIHPGFVNTIVEPMY